MKRIALIGSTGSIGTQVLSVVRRNADKFRIVSLAAGKNFKLFAEQVKEFKPQVATIADVDGFDDRDNWFNGFPKNTETAVGDDAFLNTIIDEADIVVVALVGFNGIKAVLKAIDLNKNIALANKESLVVGGELIMSRAKEKGVTITPIDSEHSAIWQALNFDFKKPFKRLILTASGGAFREYFFEGLKTVKGKDALLHPTWNMGAKITVDSATLMNKAFEVAEAHWLYEADFDKIDVIIHKESIIHSMVEFCDNSVIAQMSYPNMELPIQIALFYPERYMSSVPSLDFVELGKLTFGKMDDKKFPCFAFAVEVIKKGGLYPAVLNGANESIVKAFLDDRINYFTMFDILREAVDAFGKDGNVKFELLRDAVERLQAANDFGKNFVEKYLLKHE